MRDNHGVTLIELIVVMIIMGILAGGLVFGVQRLDSGNVNSTAKCIKTVLSQVRMENMSKDKPFYLVIEEKDQNYYVSIQIKDAEGRVSEIIMKDKLDLKKGNITFYYKDDPTEYYLRETVLEGRQTKTRLEVSFRKDTGGLKANTDGALVNRIKINAGGKSYSIRLVEATGKYYVE